MTTFIDDTAKAGGTTTTDRPAPETNSAPENKAKSPCGCGGKHAAGRDLNKDWMMMWDNDVHSSRLQLATWILMFIASIFIVIFSFRKATA